MESVKELRNICQKPRRECDTWYGINVCRKLSIYITRVLLPLGVTADAVTVVFLAVGVLSCLFFAMGTVAGFVLGTVTLHLWYLVDHVDGEIARYRNNVTATGGYFDKMVHFIVHPSVYFCIGIGVYRAFGVFAAVPAGFTAGLSMLLVTATKDLKDATIFQKAAYEGKDLFFGQGGASSPAEDEGKSFPAAVFSFVHKLCTFPNDMNVITFAVLIGLLAGMKIMLWLLPAYIIMSTTVWAGILYVNVTGKRTDSEMKGLIR